MTKPILCLDFDGVIHGYDSGWQGVATIRDMPTEGFFEWLAVAIPHFQIAIYSARSSHGSGRRAMEAWLHHHYSLWLSHNPNATPIPIDEITYPAEKPPAMVAIDDRAMTFNGDWSEFSPARLKAFKPWNKR